MKIAAAAFPIDWFDHFADYQKKLRRWVEEAAGQGAQLLVFPEYGSMELASLLGADEAADLQRSIDKISDLADQLIAIHTQLAKEFRLTILGASMPLHDPRFALPVNRAFLYHPDGRVEHQDKQIMTRFEREQWFVGPGDPLRLFDVNGIKTGILICYDSEFPLLGRQLVEQGAELILSPSCTDGLAGYNRVRIGAMARALEGQMVVVHSPTVGSAPWSYAVDENVGAAAIYGPPDIGFPPSGIIAQGRLNEPGWVYGEVDFAAVNTVRSEGRVLNFKHWNEQFRQSD